MGQVIQVNGDYNIKAGAGKTITLDTGVNEGNVRVTGDLIVDGDTLTVSAENLNVSDNIITLNYGETGPGVSKGSSGILVDRGPGENQPGLIFIESDQSWNVTSLSGGSYNYANSILRVQKIVADPDENSGKLTLLDNNAGVLTVGSSLNYEDRVSDENDIPNKRYVDRAIEISPTYQIRRDDTRIIVLDVDDPIDSSFFPIGPYISQPTESLISIQVDITEASAAIATFYTDRAVISKLQISTETPSEIIYTFQPDTIVLDSIDSGGSIKLNAPDGNVEIVYGLQFTHTGSLPAFATNTTVLYGDSVSTGDSGLYFVNASKSDELISKNRALVYSMLF